MKVKFSERRSILAKRAHSADHNTMRIVKFPQGTKSIIDTGTDQSCVGKGYTVVNVHDETYISGGKRRQVVDAVTTLVDPLRGYKTVAIIRVNRALYMPENEETLLAPDQLMWNDVDVDTKAIAFGGSQHVVGHNFTINLLWDGKLIYFCNRKVDKEKDKGLRVWTLTSPSKYSPEKLALEHLGKVIIQNDDVSLDESSVDSPVIPSFGPGKNEQPTVIPNKRRRMEKDICFTPKPGDAFEALHEVMVRRKYQWETTEYIWKPHQMEEWKRRLHATEEVVKNTFKATTQLVPSLKHENQTVIKDYHVPRFPMLNCRRLQETVFADVVSWKISGKDNYAIFFVGQDSKMWTLYNLGVDASAARTLECFYQFVRDVGAPQCIVSDYANNLTESDAWKRWMRLTLTKIKSTEAHKHNQNFVERNWQSLKYEGDSTIQRYNIPPKQYGAMYRHICDCHNHSAIKSNGWRTPIEKVEGETPDISVFRYYFWQPVWYLKGKSQFPDREWVKGRFIGVAWNVGDQMTYEVAPDIPSRAKKPKGKHTEGRSVCRSLIVPRHPDENGPRHLLKHSSDYYFPTPKLIVDDPSDTQSEGRNPAKKRKRDDQTEGSDDEDSLDESELEDELAKGIPEIGPIELKLREEYLKMQKETDERAEEAAAVQEYLEPEEMEIIGHRVDTKQPYNLDKLRFVCLYQGDKMHARLGDLKVDAPVTLANYIKRNKSLSKVEKLLAYATGVLETRDKYLHLAQDLEDKTGITTRRYKAEGVACGSTPCIKIMRRTAKHSNGRNKRKSNPMGNWKYGIYIPKNTEDAIRVDEANGNTLWQDAIKKEIDALQSMKTFQIIAKSVLQEEPGAFQYAPLRMIFDVKQDLRRKARLVIGGHVVDSTGHEVYASNMKTISARVLMLIAAANKMDILTGDIGNAYLYAKTNQRIYCRLGKEFNLFDANIPVGALAQVVQALYGLPTSANRWHAHLAETLRSLGYKASRGDPDVWYRPCGDLYEYIGTHTDDLMVVSPNAKAAMTQLQKVYTIKKIGRPAFHLGCDYQYDEETGTWRIGTKTYVEEAIKKAKIILSKESIGTDKTPMKKELKPEVDRSEFLGMEDHRRYQQLMGIAQWLITCGRSDITQAVTSLTRFNAAPKKGHIDAAIRVFRYLNRYPEKWITIDPNQHKPAGELTNPLGDKEVNWEEHYPDARENTDSAWPPVRGMKPLTTDVYFDSNFAHDELTRRSITGICAYIGNTPVTWISKRQGAVATSTYSAELCAAKMGAEEAVSIRYLLRSLGVPLKGSTRLIGDNLGSLQTVSDPAGTLKKKHESVAYHFVRECNASGSIQLYKIHTDFNKADPFTKALDSQTHWLHFNELLS